MQSINDGHDHETPTDCARFDAQCGAFLERELSPGDQTWMSQHLASCAECRTMVRELEAIIADAHALPGIAPSRDLWSGIESRLDTQVIPIGTATSAASDHAVRSAGRAMRSVSLRTLAIAATMLVAVTSGVTWRIATTRGDAIGSDSTRDVRDTRGASPAVASPAVALTSSDALRGDSSNNSDSSELLNGNALHNETAGITVGVPASSSVSGPSARRNTRLASNDRDAVEADAVYEREITALRSIVDDRFAELDSTTVSELRRNIGIIDRAILDSKRALARDPRSALLATQLDRALETKLALLRRVALL